MKQFKGLFIPPVSLTMEKKQEIYCKYAQRDCQMNDCKTCIYFNSNIGAFTEWYKEGETTVNVKQG